MPEATNVAVVPLTVQTDVVLEVNVTVKPEVDVAESASVPGNIDWVPIAANVMV